MRSRRRECLRLAMLNLIARHYQTHGRSGHPPIDEGLLTRYRDILRRL